MFVLVLVEIFWQFLLWLGLRPSKGREEQGVLWHSPPGQSWESGIPSARGTPGSHSSFLELGGCCCSPIWRDICRLLWDRELFFWKYSHCCYCTDTSLRLPSYLCGGCQQSRFFSSSYPLPFFLPMILIPSMTAVSPLAIQILLRGSSAEVAKQHSPVNKQEC